MPGPAKRSRRGTARGAAGASLLLLGLWALLAACGSSGSAASSATSPASVAAPASTSSGAAKVTPTPSSGKSPATEKNPPGDIPDNQAFVAYSPPGSGVTVKVPEGWARSVARGRTTFTDKLNSISLQVGAGAAPTVASAQQVTVPALRSTTVKFAAGRVTTVTRAGGRAVLVVYTGDSPPNPVTGKVVRDAFELYLFARQGKVAALTLSGPTNADNVDPWKIVSDSLRWH
ncbi:MAG: hypothetical protein M3P23_03645 [Actinomycetota bacterium]|nr:hypothetical protein [Actinomycetota bacterium]